MELFDKLGDTIVSVSKDATQKAKDLSDLDYQIANLYKLIAGYELEGFSETPEEIAVLLEMGQKSDFFECSN